MRISQIEIRTISIPFRKPYKMSRRTAVACEHVIVKVVTDDGGTGYGEGAPVWCEFESPMEAIAVSIEKYLAPSLIGMNPLNIASIHELMDRLLCSNPFAKAALDTALYDILGKELSVPICTLLGGAYRTRVPLTRSIGAGVPSQMKEEAAELLERGFKVVKVKGSGKTLEDVARIKAVRDAVGPDIPVRIDLNAGYAGADVALKAFRIMEGYDLELIEQPLARWDIEGMAAMCRALDTPIMADESLFSIHDAATLFKKEAADIFNIKVQKAGGVYRAMQIAAFAECSNIPVMIGASLETGIGQAASAHVGAAARTLRYASDMRTPLNLVEDLLVSAIPIESGDLLCPEAAGLGISVDERVLEKYTRQKVLVR
jgi:L-Ala-D/L-Glu epimerase